MAEEEAIKRQFELMVGHLDERTRRRLAASEAVAIGRVGVSAVADAAPEHANVIELFPD